MKKWFYIAPKYDIPVRMDLLALRETGVNKAWHPCDVGVSVIGMHVRHKFYNHNCSPVIPVIEQAKDKLKQLRALPNPKLP